MTADPYTTRSAPDTNAPAPNIRMKPVDPLKLLRQYRWLLVVTAVFGAGLGVVLWWLCELFMPVYTSEPQLQVNEQPDDGWQLSAESGAVGDSLPSITLSPSHAYLLSQEGL